jgi:flagellar biosynthesis protein FliP
MTVPQDTYPRSDRHTSDATGRENAAKPTFLGFLVVMCLASGMLGILSAFASPVVAATWSRGLLVTASTFASPGVLILLGLTSWLAFFLAKTHPRSAWQNFWRYAKVFWKLYLGTVLSLIVFPASVAVTNLARLRH